MAKVIVNKFSGYRNYLSGDLTRKLDITDWTVSQVPEGLRYDLPVENVTEPKSWLIVSQTPATDTSPSIQTVQYFRLGYREESALQFTVETETTEYALPRTDDLIGYLLRDNDVVEGTTWHDRIIGGEGDDIITGGRGYDFIDGGAGADTIDGGSASDTLSYASSKGSVAINLAAGTFFGGDAEGDQVFNIERWELSDHDDFAVGSDRGDSIKGGAGNDTLFGNTGNDDLSGGDGDDVIFQGDGRGNLSGGNGNDALFAGNLGTVLNGGSGNDWLFSGEGADHVVGGEGIDWVSYSHAAGGVQTSLRTDGKTPLPQTGEAIGDAYSKVENIHGSAFDDVLHSSDGDGTVVGWDGDDMIVGSDGSNTLLGGQGDDSLSGGAGDDFLLGGAGNDIISGDQGNDYLDGEDGHDVLSASSGKNVFFDGAGNDRIFGGTGDDYFVMGGGNDIVFGGDGNDLLRVPTAGATLWRDFQNGENRLDLTYTDITRREFESTARDSANGLELKTGDGWVILADTTLDLFDFANDVLYNTVEASSEAEM